MQVMAHITKPRNLISEIVSSCSKSLDKLEKQDVLVVKVGTVCMHAVETKNTFRAQLSQDSVR